jgi:hypothetical protein
MEMHPAIKAVCRIIILGATLVVLWGCSTATAVTHYFKSTDQFRPLDIEQRVLYEPGAEQFAKMIAEELPRAIETMQHEQFGQFTKKIKIYVCATSESFEKMTGRTVKAITYRESVFLSPQLMERPELVSPYLAHELSHLVMLQHRGLYKFMTTPPWFNEGLAVYVSKGGGAGDVTEKEAVNTMLAGKVFEPNNAGGVLDFLFPKYGNRWNLKPHMFYRQASLFVSFMKAYDINAFENLLVAMQRGQSFDRSFRQAYHISTLEMWQLFIKQLKLEAEHEKTANEPLKQDAAISRRAS